MPETWTAVILGIVEGITEYLPISSTGHLILAGEALQFTGERAKTFEVVIQLGAILSVLVLYRERFLALLKGVSLKAFSRAALGEAGIFGVAGLVKLALVSVPALCLAAVFGKVIKGYLFYPLPVAAALAIGAVVIVVVDREDEHHRGSSLEELTWKQALMIGCVQCCALWPGMSRSASTIIGGMLVGLNRKAAAEFSFLAAVPILAAAAAHDLFEAAATFTAEDVRLVAIGFVVSFFTALVAVKLFIEMVSRISLRPFAYYRLALALVVVVYSYTR